MSEDKFYKDFFIKYGILTAFFAVFFFLTIYSVVISKKSWQVNLRQLVETVLEEHEPNSWNLENYVRLDNPFSMNVACYEARNRKNGELYKVVLLRVQTFYGPIPAVFLVSSDYEVEFVGVSSYHGRFAEQIRMVNNSLRIDYWKNRVVDILKLNSKNKR